MKKLAGGTQVKKGYYFDLGNWALQPVAADGEFLPGSAAQAFVYVPLLLVFLVAPLMGAAFLMFLPFIGFYLVSQAALRPVIGHFKKSAKEMAATVTPGWQPGAAHLTGRRAENGVDEAIAPPAGEKDELAQVEREIATKRGEDR